ncbi:serine/threonine-protein phosphatase Pgam5, mitochondrial-like isoform X3 [Dermacentor albipictus]|uniref:serine/threonine-protein phosphatase Pgam5, mitochondrial-like isoform X3 n=1 Tax=Dermacentor albipictus TaxID=60249 RepID=UPI0031FC780E
MLGHITKAVGILCGSVAAVSLYREEARKRQVHASWTTNFQPSAQWDFNWDRRDPESCAKPPADSSEEEKRRYDEEVQKAKATATRYLYLIRHGDFTFYEEPDTYRTLTELGRKQADLTGQRLKQLGIPFCQLTHSTMARAVETAALIHRHLPQLPLFQCELIREGEPMPPEPPFGIWKPQSKGPADPPRSLVPHEPGQLQHLGGEDRPLGTGDPARPRRPRPLTRGVHHGRLVCL